jgi:tetratricopeptide (TPR) repeat protein
MNTPTPQEQIATLKEQLIQIRKRGDCVEARQDNRSAECEILGNLGIAYYNAQDWDNAIATLTEYLNLALELEDQWQQGVACYYIGLTQQAQGEIGQGVENLCQAYRFFRHLNQEQFYTQVWQHLSQLAQYYYEQNQLTEALEIYKQQIEVLLEFNDLLNFDDLKAACWVRIEMGKVQYYQGNFQDAIAGYINILEYTQIAQERVMEMESLALAWLGCSHRELNELEPALTYFEQRLAIAQALENHSEQQETLGWLIDVAKRLEKYDTTIQYYQTQIELFKKLEDGNNVYSSLYDLAMLQFNLQQYEEALTHFSEAFHVVQSLEDNSEKIANCHFMFARCDQGLNQKDDAIANYRKAVDIYIELGVNYWANQGLEYLATLQRELRQYENAITSQQQRLGIVRELGDRVSEQSCLYDIGCLYDNLKEWNNAIEYFNQALSLATELEQKRNQANAYYMLGSSYRNLEQKEIAISNYQQAVNLYVELEVKDWAAKGLNHLANLHRSLKQYEDAVTSQQQRLEIVRELRDRVSEQSCLYAIGNIYDDLKEWEQAIKYFKLALQLAVELGGQYKQANAYYMLGQCFQGLKRVDEAIESYLQAGGLYKETKTTKWAGNVFNKLGDIYLNKIDGNKAENIEQAITYYKAALEFYTREAYPKDWAMVQVNLGYIYHRRIKGRRIENIEQSITYFTAALEVRTREKYPQKWAELQCYLGTAYTERIKGSNTQNLETAIVYLKSALESYNHQNDLKNSANVHLNLSTIYNQRSLGNITENVERALSHCQAALEFYTCEEYPENWAVIQHRLGNIYQDKNYKSFEEKADNIEQAINAYKAVLEVSNREVLPHGLILAQFSLADAYSQRVRGDKADNIEQAIALYKSILDFDDNTLYPTKSDTYIQASPEQLWSAIQNNLGLTYKKRIKGNKADNIEQAITSHKLALTVLTHEDYPQDWAKTLRGLGIVYYDQQNFQEAYNAFERSIDTVDYLRGEIISGDEVKRKLNEEWIELYILMVMVCIHLERYDKALEYADRSKARNLTELIAARDLYGSDIPEATRLQLQQIRQDIVKEKKRLQQTSQSNSSYLNQLREEFNQLSPYQPLTVPDIHKLLDKETAVIEWYISSVSNQILTFTVLPNLSESKTKETSEISLWQSSREDFRQLIDWTNTYLQDYRTNKTQWRNSLPQRLATLANILHIDEILESLFQKFPNCKRLILIPHRFLHLFPLHALPISPRGGKTQLLQDIFPKESATPPTAKSCDKPKIATAPTLTAFSPSKTPPKTSLSPTSK